MRRLRPGLVARLGTVTVAVVAVVVVSLVSGSGARAVAATGVTAPGAFVALPPTRILDTRVGTGATKAAVKAGATLALHVSGRGGVPSTGAGEVLLNLTVTSETEKGYITAFPAGTAQPISSNLNFTPGRTVANLVDVRLGAGGTISLHNGSSGSVDLIADVAGYFVAGSTAESAGGAYVPIEPSRILDTRAGTASGALKGGVTEDFQVSGLGGVPTSGVAAVVLNVTATGATANGYLSVFPQQFSQPTISSVSFAAGRSVANLVVVPLGWNGDDFNGRLLVHNGASSGQVDVILDVEGYYLSGSATAAGTFASMTPTRVMDTRIHLGASKAAAPHGTLALTVAGHGGIPATNVGAVVLNLTAVSPSVRGYLTAYPSGSSRPSTSNVNFSTGRTTANLVTVKVGPDGKVDLYNASAGSTDLVADVAGYYLTSAAALPGVWAWGSNPTGGLGTGTTADVSDAPVQLSTLAHATAITGGPADGYAVMSDGTVMAWGANGSGQLGNNTTSESPRPVQVRGMSAATAVAAGAFTGYALRSDGTVWAWGSNSRGELGIGSNDDSLSPVPVSGLSNVTAIAAGSDTGYAVRSDGTVWAWGFNGQGEVGDGTTDERTSAVQVSGLGDIVAVSAVGDTAYVLTSGGTVWAWGYNPDGRLGNGVVGDSHSPVQVSGLTDVVGIAGALALRADGTVWAWGGNDHGQLGNGTNDPSLVPTQVSGLTGIRAVAGNGGTNYSLTSDGHVWSWGSNNVNQLGDRTSADSSLPVQVFGLSRVTAIAAQAATGMALVGP